MYEARCCGEREINRVADVTIENVIKVDAVELVVYLVSVVDLGA